MKLAHSIRIRVFCHEERDKEDTIEKGLLSLFPFSLTDEKILVEKKKTKGFNEKLIIVYEVTLENDRHINAFLKSLDEKMTTDQKLILVDDCARRTDDTCNLFIRLDKEKLLKNELWITDRGGCYHIKINIAVFPKKKEKAVEHLKKIFSL